MALNNFFAIPTWQRSTSDPDAAGPVGAEIQPPLQKATRIQIAGDGQVEYLEEVPLQAFRSRNLDLTIGPQVVRIPPQLSGTVEIRCPKGKCRTNHSVVRAVFPYGFDWFSASRFKPGFYHGRRRDGTAKAAADELVLKLKNAEAPQEVLEESEFDPFESGDKMLVARFLDSVLSAAT